MGGLTRFGEILLWMFFVYRVKTVTCQVKVEGFVGGSVLLPCIYNDPLPEIVSFFWRDKDNSNVLDVIQNNQDLPSQSEKFRGRVSSFPEEYKKGNFSISMEKLQQSDSGPYECLIPKVDFRRRLLLAVSGKRVEAATTTPPGPSGGSTAVTPNSVYVIVLSLPLSFLFTSFN